MALYFFPRLFFIFCPQFYSFMMVLGWGLRFGFLVRLFSWGLGPVCGAFLVFVGLGPWFKHRRITLGIKVVLEWLVNHICGVGSASLSAPTQSFCTTFGVWVIVHKPTQKHGNENFMELFVPILVECSPFEFSLFIDCLGNKQWKARWVLSDKYTNEFLWKIIEYTILPSLYYTHEFLNF